MTLLYMHDPPVLPELNYIVFIVTSSSLVRSRESSFLDKIRYFILASVAENVR